MVMKIVDDSSFMLIDLSFRYKQTFNTTAWCLIVLIMTYFNSGNNLLTSLSLRITKAAPPLHT